MRTPQTSRNPMRLPSSPETAPDNSTTATEVIAPAEPMSQGNRDPDATVLAEYPIDDEDNNYAETSLPRGIGRFHSYITPDEAPTAVTDSGTVADTDADADGDLTVIANSNTADTLQPSLMTQIASTFTADDLDSTAISSTFDPSQLTVSRP